MSVDRDRLTAPFPKDAIKQRQGGGRRMLSYVEGHTVIRRLNEACGDEGWSLAILKEWRDGDILKAQVELTIPGLGSRQHIGVQKLQGNDGEDIHKGAVTDALKKAATLFGVGLELYGPDYADDPPAVTTQAHKAAQVSPAKVEQPPARPEWMQARDALVNLYRESGKPTGAEPFFGWAKATLERDGLRSLADCSQEDLEFLTRALRAEMG